ncbi:TlyA family RNA methyltransferase [Chloroflexota bacterium]
MARQSLDKLLVYKGLVASRAEAQALVMAGKVIVEGKATVKAGTLVTEAAVIKILEPLPFVSRGGLKLDYALEQFHINVSGRIAVDIGASTGGFTDCLLKRGASQVYAIDVGYGQLDYRLRQDVRVTAMDRINARYPIILPEKANLATIDVSFISVEKVIPTVAKLLKPPSSLLVLIKPQFEAMRREVGKGGVVKESTIHARVLGRFLTWMTERSYRLGGLVVSPILGASGNKEFFLLLRIT